ncbi:MAG: pyridoxal-dependent decarboxylase [Gemmatimonadaceae bacterium]|nr:pyridoxal-dependent decarboxylase [Gemmatimonadaceae bacterium]
MMRDELLATLAEDATVDAAQSIVGLAVQYLAETSRGVGPVSRGTPVSDLAHRFDGPLPDAGSTLEEVALRLRNDVMREANRLSHPMYVGHQVSPPLPVAIWTDSVIAALNGSQAVREMSPATTFVERQVVRWMCRLAGLGETSGGTFTSGGTEATLTALLAARARLLPNAWTDGVGAVVGTAAPVVLCGAHAHYAVSRAVGVMGLGVRHAITVASDGYRMDPRAVRTALARSRRDGRPVLAVVATAGSTATGSFDDLSAIADCCAEFGCWLHVDASHGGSALFSPDHRHRLRGIERVDSLAWDPHKMMLLPLAAGMVLVRDAAVLDSAFAQQAPYLFHQKVDEPSYDIGPRSLQCSRRGDVLKVWAALLRYGRSGIAGFYEHLCDLTTGFHDLVMAHPRFEALHRPETNILCFRFTGADARGEAVADDVNRELRERYNAAGDGWITSTLLDGRRVLRVTIINPRTTPQHLQRVLDGVDAIGRALVT